MTAFGAALSDPAFADLGDIDNAVVALRFAGGAFSVIDESRVTGYGFRCSTEIVGSRATVRIGNHRRTHDVSLTPERSRGLGRRLHGALSRCLCAQARGFADGDPRGRQAAVTGEDALAAFVLAQACERSFHEGRTIQLRHEERVGSVRYEAA